METEYKLHDASEEQIAVVNGIVAGNNVIVDSVAGSGKTTTILHIAKSDTINNKSILLLTYNKKLRLETRHRVEALKLTNIEVHTYHSYGVRYYLSYCMTDKGIIDSCDKDIKSKNDAKYDIIILDESQDMTDVYYKYVLKIIRDNCNENYQICILGDVKQSIYDFNNADSRYLSKANNIFSANDKQWARLNLSTTFRLTSPMCTFLQKTMKVKNIKSSKQGCKPYYLMMNPYNARPIAETIRKLLTIGYTLSDIFILAPSVRSQKSPCRILANYITKKYAYPIYVPNNDEEKLDADILKGKLVFSTYHQTKGLERKVTIVYNIDSSYFKFFKKHAKTIECPNEIYVALTRASEHLIMIHSLKEKFMPFMDIGTIIDNVNIINDNILSSNPYYKITYQLDRVIGKDLSKCYKYDYYKQLLKLEIAKAGYVKETAEETIKEFSVTDLTKHIPSRVLIECMRLIHYDVIEQESRKIKVPIKVKQENGHEAVSEINGIAIPAYYEFNSKGECSIYSELGKRTPINDNLEAEDVVKTAIEYSAMRTGYNYKVAQITNHDWLTEDMLTKCSERLSQYLSDNTKYEVRVGSSEFKRPIIGYIDCIDIKPKPMNVWEFKCTTKLSGEHQIQLAIYAYMFEKMKQNQELNTVTNYKLMNILTGEIQQLKYDKDNIRKMINILVDAKLNGNIAISDEDFLAKANTAAQEDANVANSNANDNTNDDELSSTNDESTDDDVIGFEYDW